MADFFSRKINDLILGQYKDSPVFISFLKAMASEADILKDELENVKNNRYILEATGVQLDILGSILGIDRVVVDFIDNIFFGFNEDATAQSFGDLSNATTGGRFVSADENPVVSRRLGDEEYRALLFAKITKNSSEVTPNDVLSVTSSILGVMFAGGEDISVQIQDPNDDINELSGHFEIQIGAALSGSDQAFIADLDLIPRPAGVRISYLYTAPPLTLLSEDGLILFAQDGQQLEIQ